MSVTGFNRRRRALAGQAKAEDPGKDITPQADTEGASEAVVGSDGIVKFDPSREVPEGQVGLTDEQIDPAAAAVEAAPKKKAKKKAAK